MLTLNLLYFYTIFIKNFWGYISICVSKILTIIYKKVNKYTNKNSRYSYSKFINVFNSLYCKIILKSTKLVGIV